MPTNNLTTDDTGSGRLLIVIDTENDAFTEYPTTEVARILMEIATALLDGSDDFSSFRTLLDRNGKDVGRAKLYPNTAARERQRDRRHGR